MKLVLVMRSLALIGCVACQVPETAPPSCAPERCVADPAPHCIADECMDSGDCPAGLACEEPIGSNRKSCVWNPAPVQRRALRDGFRTTRSMDVTLPSAGSLAIEWDAPEGTRYVACALFGCEPVFRPESQNIRGRRGMYNFQSCVLELYVNGIGSSSTRLVDSECDLLPPPPHDIACPLDDARPEECPAYDRVIERLSLGCWAYDDYHVTAASDLAAVSLDSLPARLVDELHISDCRSTEDRTAVTCFDSRFDFFGACAGGFCEPRCVPDQDCRAVAARYFGAPFADSYTWTCKVFENSAVGVCVPMAPPAPFGA